MFILCDLLKSRVRHSSPFIVFNSLSEGQNSAEWNCRISENRAVTNISSCRVCTISNQVILFQCLFLSLWLGGHAHFSLGGGREEFPAPGLKKSSEKPCLPGIFNCAILLLEGHSNVIIILDLPVLLELN